MIRFTEAALAVSLDSTASAPWTARGADWHLPIAIYPACATGFCSTVWGFSFLVIRGLSTVRFNPRFGAFFVNVGGSNLVAFGIALVPWNNMRTVRFSQRFLRVMAVVAQ